MKKSVLGQGLSVLLNEKPEIKAGGEIYRELFTSQLEPSPYQPRKHFDDEEIFSLAESIQGSGILQPIIVRPLTSGSFEIIAGERRWRAAKKVGLDVVPVIVRDISDNEALTIAMVENLQREDLNPIEESAGYLMMMENLQITQEELSRLVGKSRSYITNFIRLSHLPEGVKELIQKGTLSSGHAKILLGLQDPLQAAEIMVERGMTVRQAERYVQRLKKMEREKEFVPRKTTSEKAYEDLALVEGAGYADEEIDKIRNFIESKLSYKSTISVKGDGKVSISIHLESMAEFDDFLGKLNMIPENQPCV